MDEFLNQYRYLALMLGTFFEGETAILLASSLIHKGIFGVNLTVIFAFAGSFISDWLYYFIGRLNGKFFLAKRPNLKMKIEPLADYFLRNKIMFLLSYRFMYGFRAIIPIMFGMTGIKPLEYLFYTVIAGFVWTSVVVSLGYFAGTIFPISSDGIRQNLPVVLICFATFGLMLGYVVKSLINKKLHLA
jgi:membrane protein DedA with SNARE-associated domain